MRKDLEFKALLGATFWLIVNSVSKQGSSLPSVYNAHAGVNQPAILIWEKTQSLLLLLCRLRLRNKRLSTRRTEKNPERGFSFAHILALKPVQTQNNPQKRDCFAIMVTRLRDNFRHIISGVWPNNVGWTLVDVLRKFSFGEPAISLLEGLKKSTAYSIIFRGQTVYNT